MFFFLSSWSTTKSLSPKKRGGMERGERNYFKGERDTEEEEEKRNLFVVFGLRFACEDLLIQREMTKKNVKN
jgi:hypothetical protein